MKVSLITLFVAITLVDGFGIPFENFFSKGETTVKETAFNINVYFDAILLKVKIFLKEKGYEPYKLHDIQFMNETKDILGKNWESRLGLYNGHLFGITTMERAGDATLRYNTASEAFELRAEVIFKLLEVEYDFIWQMLNHGPRGKLRLKVEELLAEFNTAIFPKKISMQLNDLKLKDAKDIHVEVKDIGLFHSTMVEGFINTFTALFKKSILRKVEAKVKAEAEKAIAKISPAELPFK